MFKSSTFEDLSAKLFSALPSGLQNLEQDIQKQFKSILQVGFSHLDLVTREEFDTQTKVLARTREKIDLLEKQFELMLNKKIE